MLKAADHRFGLGLSYETNIVGFDRLARHGTTFPDTVFEPRAADGGDPRHGLA